MSKLSTILKETLIFRIVIAIGLIVMGLLPLFSGFLKVIVLISSVLIVSIDIIYAAIISISNGKILNTYLLIFVCIILLFIIDYAWEGAVVAVIVSLGLFLIDYSTNIIRSKAVRFVDKDNPDIIAQLYDILDSTDSDYLLMEKKMSSSANLPLLLILVIAVLYIIFMPGFKNLSLVAAIHRAISMILIATPLSLISSYRAIGSVALCNAASNGIIFKKAYMLETIADVKLVFIDDSINGIKIKSELIYSHSSFMDNDTFTNFIYHVVYQSNQEFALAIKDSLQNLTYSRGLVIGPIDIPGFGIKASVNGMQLIFGKEELCNKFGIDISTEYNPDIRGEYYYLCLADKCVGSIVLSGEYETNTDEITSAFEENGAKCVFFSQKDEQKTSKRAILSIFMPKNAEKMSQDINIVVDYTPKDEDAAIVPDYIDNIPMIPYMSRRVGEIASHNSFFAFGIKVIVFIAAMLGFCYPFIAIATEFIASIVCILNAIRIPEASIITKIKG